MLFISCVSLLVSLQLITEITSASRAAGMLPLRNFSTAERTAPPDPAVLVDSVPYSSFPRGVTACSTTGAVYVSTMFTPGNLFSVGSDGSVAKIFGGLSYPQQILMSDDCTSIIVCNAGSNEIVRYTFGAGLSSLAGTGIEGHADGVGNQASFRQPGGIVKHPTESYYLVTDANDLIRKMSPEEKSWRVTTVVGKAMTPAHVDARGTSARLHAPAGMSFATDTDFLVTNMYGYVIRSVKLPYYDVSTVAGAYLQSGSSDGVGTGARFNLPHDVKCPTSNLCYVTDYGNHLVRRLDVPSKTVTTVAGVAGVRGEINNPVYMHILGDQLLVVNEKSRQVLSFSVPKSTSSSCSSNLPTTPVSFSGFLRGIAGCPTTGALYTSTVGIPGNLFSVNSDHQSASLLTNKLINPQQILMEGDDCKSVIICNSFSGNRIVRYTFGEGLTYLAGTGEEGHADGVGDKASFRQPGYIVKHPSENYFIVADANELLRKMEPEGDSWKVTTVAGRAGIAGHVNARGTSATFRTPMGMFFLSDTIMLLVDVWGHDVRRVMLPNYDVSTVAGMSDVSGHRDSVGTQAKFYLPHDIKCPTSHSCYITDFGNEVIRRLDLTTLDVTTVAGTVGVPTEIHSPTFMLLLCGGLLVTNEKSHLLLTFPLSATGGIIVSTNPSTTSGGNTKKDSEGQQEEEASFWEKNREIIIIVAVVVVLLFIIVLLIALVVCLFTRLNRQNTSNSSPTVLADGRNYSAGGNATLNIPENGVAVGVPIKMQWDGDDQEFEVIDVRRR